MKLLLKIRYELPVPFIALKMRYDVKTNNLLKHGDEIITFKFLWNIAKGYADINKNHLYTWEETKEWLNKRTKEKDESKDT